MTLQELFKKLSYGPFSNIALGNEGNGTILLAKYPKVIGHINEAMLRLHARFVLSEKEVIVEQTESVSKYLIHSSNAVSQGANPAYVKDSIAEPFIDDIIKIMSVYDNAGAEYPLNREGNCQSLFTPQINLLQVPVPVEGKPLYVLYQAKPVPIPLDTVDLSIEIVLPDVLERALIAYVAYEVYSGMNGQEHKAIAADHLAIYDNICMEVIERDLVSSSQSNSNSKLDDRGFV